MKILKLFTLAGLMLTAYSLQLYAQPTYDSVASFTSVTSLGATDIIPMQIKVSNKYTWRKITGASLWSRMRDTTQAQLTSFKDLSNSWNGINNFDGATFNSGSHGGVVFDDSVTFTSNQVRFEYIRRYDAQSSIGLGSAPFDRIYANWFLATNPEGNDSVSISYDDSTLTFTMPATGTLEIPNLTITQSVMVDSGAGFRQIIYEPNGVSGISTTDTTLSLSSSQKYCLALIDLAGNTSSPGISYFNITGATIGYTIRLVDVDVNFVITLKDFVGNDDNLYLTADLTLSQYDFLELMCIDETVGDQIWIETGRSNN